VVRTIDFEFDPDVDTADNLAAEISEEFSLSPTDTEICAAALREWLAKDMPGSDSNQ
jgi:WNK lysine deficient protein kinase